MIKKITLFTFIFLILTPVIPSTAEQLSIGVPKTEHHKIVNWGEEWKKLVETGEIEQLRDMYEPDAVLMANGTPPQKGVDSILKFLGQQNSRKQSQY